MKGETVGLLSLHYITYTMAILMLWFTSVSDAQDRRTDKTAEPAKWVKRTPLGKTHSPSLRLMLLDGFEVLRSQLCIVLGALADEGGLFWLQGS